MNCPHCFTKLQPGIIRISSGGVRCLHCERFVPIAEGSPEEKEIKELEESGIHTWLSPVIKTPEEVLSGSLLFLDMIFDAMILYDRNDFFKNFLNSFKERLQSLGAKRIVQGDRWYWDLKPDYRKGEIFEI